MALVKRPIYGLYGYLLAFYMHPPGRWWGASLPELRWSFIAGIFTVILILAKNKNKKFWMFTENRILSVFTIFVFFQYFWAVSPVIHIEYMVLLMKFVILVFMIQNSLENLKDLEAFIVANLLGTAYLGYVGINMHAGGRLEGLGTPGMDDANQFAMHVVAVIVFSGYFLLKKFTWYSILYIICLAISLYLLFLTESRGGIISLVFVGLLSLRYLPVENRKKYFYFIALALVAFSLLMGPQIVGRFASVIEKDETGEMQDESASSRIVVIEKQLEMFQVRPIVGHGHRGTTLLSPFYFEEKDLQGNNGVKASHNIVMSMLVDHGLIGAILYFLVIWLAYSKIAKAIKYVHSTGITTKNYQVNLLIGMGLALVAFMVAGLGASNKKLEADIWLIAIIPLLYSWIRDSEKKSEKG